MTVPPDPRQIHILNQYIWPDSAPTAIYAEQLADALVQAERSVILVGGAGSYRKSERPAPDVPVKYLESYRGKRGSHLSTLREYQSNHRSLRRYIETEVRAGDVVIVTSAPPSSITLHNAVRAVGAVGIYWLQDYYPELLRGVWNYPQIIRTALQRYWAKHLSRWNHVVKAAGNLGYDGPNSRILRNWPTITFSEDIAPEPRTAIYSGNLGYGHDVDRLIEVCAELRSKGFTITVRGDGPGVGKLPEWITVEAPFRQVNDVQIALQRAEVHLVAAHPQIRTAIFPSKIWNSLALRRPLVCTGFEKEMLQELNEARSSRFEDHRSLWRDFVLAVQAGHWRSELPPATARCDPALG